MKFPIIHYQLTISRFNFVSVELTFNPSPIEIHPESPIQFHYQKEIIHKNNFQNTFRSKLTHKTNDVNCGNPSNNHLNETGLEYPPISLSNTNILKSENKHHVKTSFQSN